MEVHTYRNKQCLDVYSYIRQIGNGGLHLIITKGHKQLCEQKVRGYNCCKTTTTTIIKITSTGRPLHWEPRGRDRRKRKQRQSKQIPEHKPAETQTIKLNFRESIWDKQHNKGIHQRKKSKWLYFCPFIVITLLHLQYSWIYSKYWEVDGDTDCQPRLLLTCCF